MNYSDNEKNLIILASLGIADKFMRRVESPISPSVFAQELKILIKNDCGGVYNKVSQSFADGQYCDKVLSQLQSRGISCVTCLSEGYPEGLKLIPDPPAVLFCKGNTALLNTRCLSVVGSRRTAAWASELCRKIASELSPHFTIVSGHALGADCAALEGALPEGKAICVLAYGHDFALNGTSGPIVQRAEKVGLVISEHFPTTPPRNYMFPVRNRIIAALSKGTLIVSAGVKSGAVITANYCMDYGRDLFALPYNPGVDSGEGCNALIKRGANLVDRAEDILNFYHIAAAKREVVILTDEEREVLSVLSDEGDCAVIRIAEKLQKPAYKLIPVLSSLEIKRQIARMGGNRYCKI